MLRRPIGIKGMSLPTIVISVILIVIVLFVFTSKVSGNNKAYSQIAAPIDTDACETAEKLSGRNLEDSDNDGVIDACDLCTINLKSSDFSTKYSVMTASQNNVQPTELTDFEKIAGISWQYAASLTKNDPQADPDKDYLYGICDENPTKSAGFLGLWAEPSVKKCEAAQKKLLTMGITLHLRSNTGNRCFFELS